MALTTISPHDAQELIARGAKLIDIRDADEYLREHIPPPQKSFYSKMGLMAGKKQDCQ